MIISYDNLWKLLIDRRLNRTGEKSKDQYKHARKNDAWGAYSHDGAWIEREGAMNEY